MHVINGQKVGPTFLLSRLTVFAIKRVTFIVSLGDSEINLGLNLRH